MRWVGLVCVLLLLAIAGGQAASAQMAGIGERTEHFNIRYDDVFALSPDTGRVLEDAYRTVNQYFDLPDSIKVVVVDDDKMDGVGKHVEAFSAWNTRSSSIVLRGDTVKKSKQLGVVVKHEICHLGINEVLQRKGEGEFAWMEEGLCMVISGEPLDDSKVAKYIDSHGYLSTEEIAQAIESKDYDVCKNGYLQSFSLCKYAAQKYGIAAVVGLVKTPDTDFKRAFRRQTGTDFGAFYAEWQAAVKRSARGEPLKHFTSRKGALDFGDVAA